MDEVLRKYCGIAPWLKEDLVSEAELERLENPHANAASLELRLRRYVGRNRSIPVNEFAAHSGPRPEARGSARVMTPGQKRRFRRDLVIQAASRAGLSQRLIADVFGLPRSRVAEIVKTDLSHAVSR